MKYRDGGFSLLEIMVAIGLLGILTTGIMQMLQYGQKGSKAVQLQMDLTQIDQELMTILTSQKGCFYTLTAGQDTNPDITQISLLTTIYDQQKNSMFVVDNAPNPTNLYGSKDITISSITLLGTPNGPNSYQTVAQSLSVPPGGSFAYGDLTILVRFIKHNGSTQTTYNKAYPISVKADASNLLQDCYSQGMIAVDTTVYQTCTSMGGIYDNNLKKCDMTPVINAAACNLLGQPLVNGTCSPAAVPQGAIIAWAGTTPPSGWAICDGNNGTPNLQGRFILGMDPAAYDKIGDTNGLARARNIAFSEMPQHQHDICLVHGDKVWTEGGGNTFWGNSRPGGTSCSDPFVTSYAGGGSPFNIMPPYYTLAYIMKL